MYLQTKMILLESLLILLYATINSIISVLLNI
jgi:hypothetical protein